MFSFAGSVCLLVLMGVVLASAGPVQYISDEVKRTQELIAGELGLTKASIGSNPLFSSVMRSINTSCQRGENLQLMNATLDVYTRIFSSILQNQQQQHRGAGTGTGTRASALLDQLPDGRRSEVEEALMKLQQKMENLKNHMNPRNHNRDDVLNKLNKIRVDDPTVQKKALAEFTEVFQTASVIGSRMC
ncbi:interferon gamma 1 [Amphiprion ocellaris]|uniref:Uncharacterized protein n=1 Tax=Amphiprion ocellaris TaxID=80972 RepID=A0A3Q1AKE7_AMPOC|nr:interferon gamma 1 [Amphiprion ocellaris]